MYTITLVNSNITLIYKSIITDPALYSDSFNGVFVSVWALASALGRVNIGYLSQSVYNTNGRKISVWHPLPFISVAMAVACAVQMYMYRCICILCSASAVDARVISAPLSYPFSYQIYSSIHNIMIIYLKQFDGNKRVK